MGLGFTTEDVEKNQENDEVDEDDSEYDNQVSAKQ